MDRVRSVRDASRLNSQDTDPVWREASYQKVGQVSRHRTLNCRRVRERWEPVADCGTVALKLFRTKVCGDKRHLSLGTKITERPTLESIGPFPKVSSRLALGGIWSTETGLECDNDHRSFHRRFPSLSEECFSFTPHSSHTHRKWDSIGSRGTSRGSRPSRGKGGQYGMSGF